MAKPRNKIRLPHEVETARVEMVKARTVLDAYETLHGFASNSEHARLTKTFNEFAESYLVISTHSFIKERTEKF